MSKRLIISIVLAILMVAIVADHMIIPRTIIAEAWPSPTPQIGCGEEGMVRIKEDSYFILIEDGQQYKGRWDSDYEEILMVLFPVPTPGPAWPTYWSSGWSFEVGDRWGFKGWTIIRCGYDEFAVWKTAELEKSLPPTPTPVPTQTPIAVFGP